MMLLLDMENYGNYIAFLINFSIVFFIYKIKNYLNFISRLIEAEINLHLQVHFLIEINAFNYYFSIIRIDINLIFDHLCELMIF
jgi:hypothetical protein